MGKITKEQLSPGFKAEIEGFGTSLSEKANIYNDGLIFGMEYLTHYLDKVRTGTTTNIILSSDSQLTGVSLTDSNYKLDTLMSNYLKSKGVFNVNVINDAINGQNTSQWALTQVDLDLAKNPDLYVLDIGANDASQDLATRFNLYKGYLEQGLQKVRASKNANQLSIIIMVPLSTDDPLNHRTPDWFKQINVFIKEMARKYQCCFVDTYSYLMDSKNVKWQDEINYGDGYLAHVHPLESAHALLLDLFAPLILPKGLLVENGLWKDVTLQNAWVNSLADGASCQYRKNELGEVEIKGCIKSGSIAMGDVILTLPVGYRLSEHKTVMVANGGSLGLIKIFSTGNVIALALSNNAWTDFGNLSFKAEQ